MLNKRQLRLVFDVYQDAYMFNLDGIAYGVKVALRALVEMRVENFIIILTHVISDLKDIQNDFDHNPTIKNFIRGSIVRLQGTEKLTREYFEIS